MNEKLKEYLKDNWDGWPLHLVLAVSFFLCAKIFDPATVLLILNTIFWPDREATQHYDKKTEGNLGRLSGYKNIWTFHRIMEWGAPILGGFAAYYLWHL